MHVTPNAKCLGAENRYNACGYKRISTIQPLKRLRILYRSNNPPKKKKPNNNQTGIIGMRAVVGFVFDEVLRDEVERLLGPVPALSPDLVVLARDPLAFGPELEGVLRGRLLV